MHLENRKNSKVLATKVDAVVNVDWNRSSRPQSKLMYQVLENDAFASSNGGWYPLMYSMANRALEAEVLKLGRKAHDTELKEQLERDLWRLRKPEAMHAVLKKRLRD